MQKRKILVTGSKGTVGSYVSSIFPQDTVFLTTKETLDITNKKNVIKMFKKLQPNVVIHLAAKTNVDECEREENEAHIVNVLGTQNVAEGSKEINSILVYISTAAVFDGRKKFYTERAKPNPINIYGKTKLQGEKIIEETNKHSIIIRSGWMIGGGKKEKKFISYILQQAQNGAKTIDAVNDKFGTLTYAKELIEYIKFLLDRNSYGVYHFGSLGICSRYEIAKHLVKQLNIDVAVKPVSSSIFADKFFAPRPKYEVIRSLKHDPVFSSTWKESLSKYIMDELKDE